MLSSFMGTRLWKLLFLREPHDNYAENAASGVNREYYNILNLIQFDSRFLIL